MNHRVNVVLDESVYKDWQAVPAGERSKLLNETLSQEFLRRRRLAAAASMDALRMSMKPIPGNSVEWLREDRASH